MILLRGYTGVAFGCILMSGLMGLFQGTFIRWVLNQGAAHERVAMFLGSYGCMSTLFRDVGLLVFLVALLIADRSATGRDRDAEY